MNTPAHLIFGAAVFARPGHRAVSAASIFGALLPDLSLYLLVGWSMLAMGLSADVVFRDLYFSDLWQGIFAVDNSIPLWGAGLAVAVAMRNPIGLAFAGSGVLHLVFDFALHHDDARRHFWPVSDWVFISPVSYWDTAHYGGIVAPLEVAACIVLSIVLWQRFHDTVARMLIALGLLAEATPAVMFALMFAD